MTQSPFKFLDAYQKEDKDIFFGREKETEILYNQVFKSNLFLLYGASGTGKTSLINCGLANKFSETDWYSMSIRRRDNLNLSLFNTIQLNAVTRIEKNTPIRQALYSLYLDHYLPIYLIFDQFEELFILGSQSEQQEFFEQLSEILQAGLQCKIILSLREEYLAYLSDYEKLVPSLFDHRFRIERMNLGTIAEVIVNTTRSFEIQIRKHDSTVEKIIEQLRNQRQGIDLTHLQVYLDRLFREATKREGEQANQTEIVFDPELIDQVGKVENVLGEFLEEQLAEIDFELGKEGVALAVLFVFVSDDGTNQYINQEYLTKYLLETKSITKEEVDFCLKKFEAKRILKQVSIINRNE